MILVAIWGNQSLKGEQSEGVPIVITKGLQKDISLGRILHFVLFASLNYRFFAVTWHHLTLFLGSIHNKTTDFA